MSKRKPTIDLNAAAAKALAEKIAAEIMRNGANGKKATRLVLEHDGRLCSGWSERPLADRIQLILTGDL